MESTWLVQTQVILYITPRWAVVHHFASEVDMRTCHFLCGFFEDNSVDSMWILVVARKSNITSQGASASVNERSRKNRFGFQFWLESFFHGEQNVQFAQNLKNLKKIQRILIRINAFVAWAWCRCLLQVVVNT